MFRTLWLLAVCLLICSVAFAQSTTEGAVSGTVYDSTGAVVPNATIVVHNSATNAEKTVKSDSNGGYRALSLQPATYTVTVTAPGFAPYRAQQVIVNVGTVTELSPRLKVGNTAETVNVSAEAPQINTTSADFAPVLNNVAISNLPINGNRWSNFVLLTPTVVNDGSGFGLVSFRGMSVLLNNNTVDGADNNDAFWGEERGRTRAGYSSAKAAVQEFQANTSNYSAEYGRSAGGVVNTVTKSGSNSLHGEAYFYDRDNSWGATNPFTVLTTNSATTPGAFVPVTNPYKPVDRRKISGFAIGGPIKKDKLFFFLAFDWYNRNFPGTAVPSSSKTFFTPATNLSSFICSATGLLPCGGSSLVSNLGIGSPQLTACGGTPDPTSAVPVSTQQGVNCYNNGLLGLLSQTGRVPRTGEQFIWFPKVDWQVSSKHRASFEANRMVWASPAGIQTQATNTDAVNAFGNDYAKAVWGIARLDSLITNNLSNQVRYQYGKELQYSGPQSPNAYDKANLITSPNSPGYVNPLGFAPNVFITGGFDMGVVSFLPRPKYPDERRHQIADNMTWAHGKHTLKFGMDFSHVNDLALHNEFQFGSFSYSSITNYLSDLYKPNSCGAAASGGVAAHAQGCYFSYKQGFGPLGFEFQTNDVAMYVQDDWRILPRLTLNLGFRWEYEQLPGAFKNLFNADYPLTGKVPSDKNNIGPRVGFAWDITGDGKTSFRGGYGMYFARVINSTVFNVMTSTGVSGAQSLFSYTSTTGPLNGIKFPQIVNPTVVPTGGSVKPSLFYFDRNFQLPQIHQIDLTMERDLGWNTVFSVSYMASLGQHLPSFVDTNLAKPTTSLAYTITDVGSQGPLGTTGTIYNLPVYTVRPDARYGPITNVFSGVASDYQAVVFQFNHRMSHHLQFGTNVTWSATKDYNQNQQTFTDINDFLFPTDSEFVKQGYGRSKYDVPLRWVLHAVWQTPWHKDGLAGYFANGWQISPVIQAQSGLPFTMQASGGPSGSVQGGINGSGTGTGYTSAQGNYSGFNYIPGIGRNTFRGRRTAYGDLKVSKTITYKERYSMEFSGEFFNLTNHVNTTGISTTGYLLGGTLAAPTMQYCGVGSTCNTVFGTRTNANSNFAYTPRQVQLGLRLKF